MNEATAWLLAYSAAMGTLTLLLVAMIADTLYRMARRWTRG